MAQWKPLKDADGKSGVRFREHPTRKHGAVADRYYTTSYRWQGKTISESIGWASEGWTPSMCFGLLSEIKHNQATGIGPCTMAELRARTDKKRVAEQAEVIRQDAVFADAWVEYLECRRDKWSERHYTDHLDIARIGGEPVKKRGRKGAKIKPGPLAALMPLKLSELTPERIETWAKSSQQKGLRGRVWRFPCSGPLPIGVTIILLSRELYHRTYAAPGSKKRPYRE